MDKGGRWTSATGSGVRVVERTALCDISAYGFTTGEPGFDVTVDGQEFIVVDGTDGAAREPIVVVNWLAEMERR